MTAHARIRGLYAVTPDEPDTGRLLAMVGEALQGGARAVQYRNKPADARLRLAQVEALLALCRGAGAPLIVNDDLDLALAAGADGVHLGQDDGDLALARTRLGPGRLLGASCYNRLTLALAAADQGADYVAFGSAFRSPIKPSAVHAPLELFRSARARLAVPIVAIGGITPQNARQVIDAGADALAVITALFGERDVRAAAAAFARLFSTGES